jgi:hypothetical protein
MTHAKKCYQNKIGLVLYMVFNQGLTHSSWVEQIFCKLFVTIKPKDMRWALAFQLCFWETSALVTKWNSLAALLKRLVHHSGGGVMGSMLLFTTDKLMGKKACPMPGQTTVLMGQFRRAQRLRQLAVIGIALLFVITGVGSLTAYALRMQVEHDVTQLTQDTRNLDELNKTLTISLNRAQSFLHIAEKANQSLPRLQASAEVIDIPANPEGLLRLPKTLKRQPAPAAPLPGL